MLTSVFLPRQENFRFDFTLFIAYGHSFSKINLPKEKILLKRRIHRNTQKKISKPCKIQEKSKNGMKGIKRKEKE